MGIGTAIHYFGTLLLLVGTILLIVASVSPPTVKDLSFLKVWFDQGNNDQWVKYGAFGWCTSNHCSGTHIGYDPTDAFFNVSFSNWSHDTVKGLTNVFILHPIAAAIAFVAFLFSLKTGFLSIVTTLIALLAFIVTVVCLAVDFAAFETIKHHVKDNTVNGHAEFGPAIWCVLAAAIATLAGAVIVFITCCAGRRRNKYENRKVHGGY